MAGPKSKRNASMLAVAQRALAENTAPSPTQSRAVTPGLQLLESTYDAVHELDPDLIDDWGIKDRMEEFTAVNLSMRDVSGFAEYPEGTIEELAHLIQENGQRVPILVRQSKSSPGRYEVIFGRRRLAACRFLKKEHPERGITVKANITAMDDDEALVSKILENTARKDLSFYEKARFVADILSQTGKTRSEIGQIMSLTKSGISNLERITRSVPRDLGELIGPAPKYGRTKWLALAEALDAEVITETQASVFLRGLDPKMSSDGRLAALLAEIKRRSKDEVTVSSREIREGVQVRNGKGSIKVSVSRTGEGKDFATWLDANIEEIIENSYQRFKAETPEE